MHLPSKRKLVPHLWIMHMERLKSSPWLVTVNLGTKRFYYFFLTKKMSSSHLSAAGESEGKGWIGPVWASWAEVPFGPCRKEKKGEELGRIVAVDLASWTNESSSHASTGTCTCTLPSNRRPSHASSQRVRASCSRTACTLASYQVRWLCMWVPGVHALHTRGD